MKPPESSSKKIAIEDTDELIKRLVSDRQAFNDFVYTPLDKAVLELNLRKNDSRLKKYCSEDVLKTLPISIKDKRNAVIFRNLATPNYEIRRFISIVDAIDDFRPIFFEYSEDKFTDNNEWKYSLGKISFFIGNDKNGKKIIQRVNILDFTKANGKKIKTAKTIFGQSLVDFHHELFEKTFTNRDKIIFHDISDWLKDCGGKASNYYEFFLKLFLTDSILFENFLLDVKELDFTKNIFLPAFIKIFKETGIKPLIVALEPTDIEGDEFWLCHPHTSIAFVKNKIKPV